MNTWSLILFFMALIIALFMYFTTMFSQTRSFEYKGRIEPSNILVTKIFRENK